MSVMIWDSASQAFSETTEVPKRFDAESGAWVDTTGMSYDNAAGAWTERWSPEKRLYLYNEGDECTKVTGGWVGGQAVDRTSYSAGTLTKNATSMTVRTESGQWYWAITIKTIDLTDYNTLKAIGHSDVDTSVCVVPINMKYSEFVCYVILQNLESEVQYDISSIKGEFYIVLQAAQEEYGTVSRIWLE